MILKFIGIGLMLLMLSGCMVTIPTKTAMGYLKNNPIQFNFNVYANGRKEIVASVKGTLKF